MSLAILRVSAVICLATWLTPTAVTAEPITDLKPFLVGDGFVLQFGHTLTPEDWLLLSDRDDNGWHLGWFKRKLREGGEAGGTIDVGSGWPGTLPIDLVPDLLTNPLLPLDPNGFPTQQLNTNAASPAAIATPEPASVILLGSGLLLVARRMQKRRSDRR